MLQRLLVVLAGCIHPESRCAAVLAVHLHDAAHVLTQLFFENAKKSKAATTATLPDSLALF